MNQLRLWILKIKIILLILLNDLKSQLNVLILFVTHDIDSIKDICDEIVIILKNGEIIEKGLTHELYYLHQKKITQRD
jgi:peptide/nickel transport system ATP-binding protein